MRLLGPKRLQPFYSLTTIDVEDEYLVCKVSRCPDSYLVYLAPLIVLAREGILWIDPRLPTQNNALFPCPFSPAEYGTCELNVTTGIVAVAFLRGPVCCSFMSPAPLPCHARYWCSWGSLLVSHNLYTTVPRALPTKNEARGRSNAAIDLLWCARSSASCDSPNAGLNLLILTLQQRIKILRVQFYYYRSVFISTPLVDNGGQRVREFYEPCLGRGCSKYRVYCVLTSQPETSRRRDSVMPQCAVMVLREVRALLFRGMDKHRICLAFCVCNRTYISVLMPGLYPAQPAGEIRH